VYQFYSHIIDICLCLWWAEMYWHKVVVKVLLMVCYHRRSCKTCNERNCALTVAFLSFRIVRKCLWNSTINTTFYS
jgi:hypothetical protein